MTGPGITGDLGDLRALVSTNVGLSIDFRTDSYRFVSGDVCQTFEAGELVETVCGDWALAEAACCFQAGHYRQTQYRLIWG